MPNIKHSNYYNVSEAGCTLTIVQKRFDGSQKLAKRAKSTTLGRNLKNVILILLKWSTAPFRKLCKGIFSLTSLSVSVYIFHVFSRTSTEPSFTPIPDRPYHDRRYHIDFSKINRELFWSCTTPFHVGLTATIQYYIDEYLLEKKQSQNRDRLHG